MNFKSVNGFFAIVVIGILAVLTEQFGQLLFAHGSAGFLVAAGVLIGLWATISAFESTMTVCDLLSSALLLGMVGALAGIYIGIVAAVVAFAAQESFFSRNGSRHVRKSGSLTEVEEK